jgi:3-oxoacyl-[acyl-carrier protein] reductase
MLLKDKRMIITGAASGIGAACAQRSAEEGAAFILIADLNFEAASEKAKEIEAATGCKCVAVKTDVANEADIRNVFAEYLKNQDRLDVLVNCAGVGKLVDMNDITCDSWDLTMRINLRSVFLFSREALKIMEPQRYGRIVNMSSQAGKSGGIMIGMDYSASKGGVLSLTKSLARQAAPYNVTVNSVAPGLIATAMTAHFGYDAKAVPLGRIGTPEEVADAVIFVASDMARYITGACIDVNGGILMS